MEESLSGWEEESDATAQARHQRLVSVFNGLPRIPVPGNSQKRGLRKQFESAYALMVQSETLVKKIKGLTTVDDKEKKTHREIETDVKNDTLTILRKMRTTAMHRLEILELGTTASEGFALAIELPVATKECPGIQKRIEKAQEIYNKLKSDEVTDMKVILKFFNNVLI